jgi:hypothetical protein
MWFTASVNAAFPSFRWFAAPASAAPVEIARFDGVGNFGIGTTSPSGKLSIVGTPGNVPYWAKYALVAIANGVNGCANANGCWQVNGVLGANKTAGFTQDVILFQLPSNGYVDPPVRIKTATACTGSATALTGLGTAGNNVFYRAQTYDIQAAPSATNFGDALAASGSTTTAAVNVVASLITTINNIDQLVAGCAVDYWVKWAVLP